MPIVPAAVIGTGMAGFGPGYALESSRAPFVCYDKNDRLGEHTLSLLYHDGFVFDEGGTISVTKQVTAKLTAIPSVNY
jgi:protoporphyrinogen oxidase